MNARTRLIQSIAAPIDEARTLVDLHHAEVTAARDAQIIAWLEKKAREEGRSNKERRDRGDAIARMADKLSRGAVYPPMSGAFAPLQENYPGELVMLRGLLGVLQVVAKHSDMAEVQRLLTEYAADEHAAYGEEKDTAPAATSTPESDFFQPGTTYSDPDPAQYDWQFRCDTVTTRPDNGERTALGWRHFRGKWEPYAYGEDDWDTNQECGLATTEAPSG